MGSSREEEDKGEEKRESKDEVKELNPQDKLFKEAYDAFEQKLVGHRSQIHQTKLASEREKAVAFVLDEFKKFADFAKTSNPLGPYYFAKFIERIQVASRYLGKIPEVFAVDVKPLYQESAKAGYLPAQLGLWREYKNSLPFLEIKTANSNIRSNDFFANPQELNERLNGLYDLVSSGMEKAVLAEVIDEIRQTFFFNTAPSSVSFTYNLKDLEELPQYFPRLVFEGFVLLNKAQAFTTVEYDDFVKFVKKYPKDFKDFFKNAPLQIQQELLTMLPVGMQEKYIGDIHKPLGMPVDPDAASLIAEYEQNQSAEQTYATGLQLIKRSLQASHPSSSLFPKAANTDLINFLDNIEKKLDENKLEIPDAEKNKKALIALFKYVVNRQLNEPTDKDFAKRWKAAFAPCEHNLGSLYKAVYKRISDERSITPFLNSLSGLKLPPDSTPEVKNAFDHIKDEAAKTHTRSEFKYLLKLIFNYSNTTFKNTPLAAQCSRILDKHREFITPIVKEFAEMQNLQRPSRR